jgi:hypothetical protein
MAGKTAAAKKKGLEAPKLSPEEELARTCAELESVRRLLEIRTHEVSIGAIYEAAGCGAKLWCQPVMPPSAASSMPPELRHMQWHAHIVLHHAPSPAALA